MLLVDRAHQCCRWRKDFVDEDEDGLLRCELDTLPDHVDKLPDSEILSIGELFTFSEQRKTKQSNERTEGTRYFFLSMVGMSVLSAFSQITYGSSPLV